MVNPVTGPSGGTPSTSTTPSSTITPSVGTSDPSSNNTPSNVTLPANIADLFSNIDSLTSILSSGSSTTNNSGDPNTPILPAPVLSLLSFLSTLNTSKSTLSETIQSNTSGNADVFQSLCKNLLAIGGPQPGSSAPPSADFINASGSVQQWSNVLSNLENGPGSNNPLLALSLYLLPESSNSSGSQNLTNANAAGASGGGFALSAGTQTMTGASYFGALVRALFKEAMQGNMLTDAAETLAAQKAAAQASTTQGEATTTATTSTTTTPTTGSSGETPSSPNVEQALTFLLTQASVLSNQPAFSLLSDANNATLQNPQILEAAKATAVLATLVSLLRPESIAKASSELASVFGINLQGLSPTDQTKVTTGLAQFLQSTLAKSGLTAFFQAIQGIYNKNATQNQTLALNNRLSTLSSVLNGAPLTNQTLSDTLSRFQQTAQGSLTGPSITSATAQLIGTSLQGAGVDSSSINGLTTALTQGVTGLFSQSTPVTATQIQQTIANALNNPTLNPNQVTLNAQQQNTLTNNILSLASSVTTQQETQTALIQNGAATAASRFSAQLSQVLYGFSVNLLNGTVTPSNASANTPSAATLAATSSFDAANKANVDLGTFLLKLMEPANVTLQLANPVMYAGPESNIAGDRNLIRPNRGP